MHRLALHASWLQTFCALVLATVPRGDLRPPEDRASVDQTLSRIEAKYKQLDKKYDTLAGEMEKAVRKALASAAWLSEKDAGAARPLAGHPYLALVSQLAAAAQAEVSKPDAKRKANREAMLAKFPWNTRLELDLGLDQGSDRPVPTNEVGFIALGTAPDPVRGFPELEPNQYLYGLEEIVGWRAGVKLGKKLAFAGRDPKKPLAIETSLPDWERIRVLLLGTLPEVPLFAMPQLTHAIHARLAERRKSASEAAARMDEELAFLDSKWDGFTLQVPFSKERLVVVEPVHALMTDRNGFFYGFPSSAHMADVGDLPFVSIQTYQQYAQVFVGQKLDSGEFIQNSDAGKAAGASFMADCAYLARYKTLIDAIVRAILCPRVRYPEYLAFVDYPKDKMPSERKLDREFDVPRKHAVLVWAYVGKDPAKLADFLFENLLDKEANRFPNSVSLAALFTTLVREKEPEMMKAIAARITAERASGGPGDFEREFSPYAEYLGAKGDPASDYLLESFQAFHEPVTKLIRETALAVVQKEIGSN